MLLVLANWIYISILCISLGDAGLKGFSQLYGVEKEKVFHPTLRLLTGLALLTFLANTVSLFYRVNFELNILLIIGSSVWVFFNRKTYGEEFLQWKKGWSGLHWFAKLAGFALLAIALLQTSSIVDHFDEGGYYLPLVRWIEQYPVVPGTGWLIDRMAYNSAYHMSNALFSHPYIFPEGSNDLTACLFAWINIYFLGSLNRLLKGEYHTIYSDLLLSAALIFPFSFLNNSMDSDYPNIFIGFILIALWVRKIEQKKSLVLDQSILIILTLGLYLLTVRLSSSLFLLFPALVILATSWKKNPRIILLTIGIGSIYILPWLIRNYYLSGYLVYPFYFLDFFNPDWKLPIELAKANYQYIAEYAKRMAPIEGYAYGGIYASSIQEWFPIWKGIMHQTLLDTLVYYTLPLSYLAFLFLWVRRKAWEEMQHLKLTLLYILLVLTLWFFSFPGVRFAWTWILSFMLLNFAVLSIKILKIPERILPIGFSVLIGLMLMRAVFREVTTKKIPPLVFPEKTIEVDNFREEKLGEEMLKIVPGVECWGLNPPCKPAYNLFDIELRGERLQDGFREKK